jgi:hypothetical protein
VEFTYRLQTELEIRGMNRFAPALSDCGADPEPLIPRSHAHAISRNGHPAGNRVGSAQRFDRASNVFQKQLAQRAANPVFIIGITHALLTLAELPCVAGTRWIVLGRRWGIAHPNVNIEPRMNADGHG